MPLFFITNETKTKPECDTTISLENFTSVFDTISQNVVAYNAETKEQSILKTAYKVCLENAINKNYESIAMPFVTSNNVCHSTEQNTQAVIKTITDFLETNDNITVFLIVNDKKIFNFDETLKSRLSSIIDTENHIRYRKHIMPMLRPRREDILLCDKAVGNYYIDEMRISEIEDILKNVGAGFAVTLLKLIELKNMSEVECYKKANVSRQTWFKILHDEDYKPSKNTILAFAVSLGLSLEETQNLLATAGFTLSNSSKFDMIIEYLIDNKIYDMMKINEMLFEFDLPCLGLQ